MPAYLSSGMRRALADLADGPRYCGAESGKVPHGTAEALIRRGLAESEEPGKVRLTDAGRLIARDVLQAHRRILDASGE